MPEPSAHPLATPKAVRIGPELVLAAATRLVSQGAGDIETAARRLVSTAPSHGIDLSLIWGVVGPGSPATVRQACLAVAGAGRTAMLFLSEPPLSGEVGSAEAALAERCACLKAACAFLARDRSQTVQIAQALPDPAEPWFVEAVSALGFTKVGDLLYLRRPATALPRSFRKAPFPPELTVVSVNQLAKTGLDDLLIAAMDRSYADTLDCPELCGLRCTRDILASHRDTGKFDPASWWVVLREGDPLGCAFFSAVPDAASSELVYLGLAPEARGRGLGRQLLAMGIEHLRKRHPGWPMTLAVDQRNSPALALYDAFGFRNFGSRIAFVKPLQGLA